jgi:hypothetical protein
MQDDRKAITSCDAASASQIVFKAVSWGLIRIARRLIHADAGEHLSDQTANEDT